ncbi:MAG: Rid family hydrolase [Pseudomonadota bacterium]
MKDKPAMNAVWKEWLAPANLPTRATIGVNDLEPNVRLEVIVTAAKG